MSIFGFCIFHNCIRCNYTSNQRPDLNSTASVNPPDCNPFCRVSRHGRDAFSGQWVELWQNGELIQEDFTPFLADVESGTEYQVFIYDDPDESKFFDHWDDGSTNPTRTITPLLDTTLTAFFQTDTAPDPTTGTATITVESADMSGTMFPGQWVELWQNEILLDEGFSPFSVSIDVDTPYEVFIYDDPEHGNFFDHWDDDSTNPTRTIAIASDATITAFFQTDTTNTTQ